MVGRVLDDLLVLAHLREDLVRLGVPAQTTEDQVEPIGGRDTGILVL